MSRSQCETPAAPAGAGPVRLVPKAEAPPKRAGRLVKPRPEGTLTAAVARCVESLGVERCVALTDRSKSQVYRWTESAAEGGQPIPADCLAALLRDGGDIAPVAFLAAEAGATVLPPLDAVHAEDLAVHVGLLGERVGVAFRDTALALADGKLTAAEAGRVVADLHAVSAATMAALAAVKAMRDADGEAG